MRRAIDAGFSYRHTHVLVKEDAPEPDHKRGKQHYLCGFTGYSATVSPDLDRVTCPLCLKVETKKMLADLAIKGTKIEFIKIEKTGRFSDYRSRYQIMINGEEYAEVRIPNGWGTRWQLVYDDDSSPHLKGSSKELLAIRFAEKVAAGNMETRSAIKARKEAERTARAERIKQIEAEIEQERTDNRERLERALKAAQDACDKDPTNEGLADARNILLILKQKGEYDMGYSL